MMIIKTMWSWGKENGKRSDGTQGTDRKPAKRDKA